MNSEAFNDPIEIEYKKQEVKPVVEDAIVSGENFVLPKLEKLDVEIEAKRSGPKSGAQTPAKPSEKRKGSSKNKPGSAGTSGDAITFSTKVIEMLKNKVKDHNSKHSRKVTLTQLKKVYRRGAGAFSSSHRPGMTRGGWAAARVNMFLRMMAGKSVKDSYRKADSDVARSSTSIDISDSWELEDIDFAQAEADIKEYDLNYDFENVEELYLDEEDNSNKFWYEL
jgi:hypothetical protein